MGDFYNSGSLSIIEQDRKIKEQFSQFVRKGNYKEGIWIGDLKPTKYSQAYKIKIVYKIKESPKVTVVKPKLLLAKGKHQLPHVYTGNELCLFLPKKREWNSNKFIAYTIIPWTSLWLSYYEDWLYTGEWKGGGEHPNRKQKSKSKQSKRIKI